MKTILLILLVSAIFACTSEKQHQTKDASETTTTLLKLDAEQANRLAQMPLHCMQQEFPNKLGQTLADENDLGMPKELHPAFYGCFDWHSSVHGHWTLIRLLKTFPELNERDL